MNKILIVIAFFLTGCLASVDAKEARDVASDGQTYPCGAVSGTNLLDKYVRACNDRHIFNCGVMATERRLCRQQVILLGKLEELDQKIEDILKKLDEGR